MPANNTPFIQELFTSRNDFPESGNSLTYIGEYQRIWWDPIRNGLYYSDGVTPGGILIGGGVNLFTNQIEGGAADSIYLTTDQINGGSAATTYTPGQIIDGGNALNPC